MVFANMRKLCRELVLEPLEERVVLDAYVDPVYLSDIAVVDALAAANQEPIAYAQSITLMEDQVTQITLTGDDGDPGIVQSLTFILDSLPANGALYQSQIDAQNGTNQLGIGASLTTGVLWFKSALNNDMDTSFMFHVKDNGGTANGGDDTSDSALVTVTVAPNNQSPDAGNFGVVVNEDTAVRVTGWNFTDAEGNQGQSIRITDLPDHGILFIDANDNNVVDPGEAINSGQTNEGRVTFTFDDGYLNNYTNAFPIMEEYGIEGVALVVTGDIGQDAGAMTWSQLQEMQAAGWEIGSHSMTHPALTQLTDSQLVYELSESKNLLIQHGLTGTSFAYPYGDFDPRVVEFVMDYYEGCREAWGNNGINETPGNPYAIYNRSVDNTTTPQEVIEWINDAVANNYWLVISFHNIVTGTASAYQYNVNNFETIVSYVAGQNIATPTISEVLNNELTAISWADATTKLKYIGDQNYSGSDSFQYVVIDSAGSEGKIPTDAGTTTVTVTAVNDAPVNSIPSSQTVNSGTDLIFGTANGNAISISDVDAGTASVRVQLTATHGTMTLHGTSGLSFTAGDGTGDATMTFTGTMTSINAALNGMHFTPTANYSGAASVQIVTNDLGHSPSGALSDSDTVNITVAGTGNPPVAGDFALSVNEDTVSTVSQWSFTDPDGDSAQSIRITDLPDHGTLFLDANSNNILDANEAISLNQAISWADAKTSPKVKYVGSSNYNGQDSLAYVVIDTGGQEGVGPAGDGTGTITVTGVNDAPVNAVPAAQTMNQNGTLTFSTANNNAISISDVDAGADSVRVQLSATNGNLTLGGTGGLSFTVGDGTGDAIMTFTGSMTSINAALNGMSFSPTSNYSGAASIQIITNDLGHNPSGEMSDSDTVNITVSQGVNHEPIAYAQSITLTENQVTQITLTGDDGDSGVTQTLTFVLDSVPANGALYLSQADAQSGTNPLGVGASLSTGILWYKSALNADADTSFMFHVKDNGGTANGGDDTSASVLVTVTVSPDNQSPDAGNFSTTTNEDTAVRVTGWNFTDAEGNQAQSIRITDLPENGTLFIDANDNNQVDPGEAISLQPNEGRVTFTFDDGYLDTYTNAFRIMETYDVDGVSLVVTGDIGQDSGAMTWSQLQQMQTAGWEIGSHSMTHPMLTQLTDSQLVYELSESKNLLDQYGLTGTSFAYPYGDFDPRVAEFVSRYYEGCREAWGNNGINEIPGNPYAIYNRSVDNTTTPQEVIQWINDAVANNYWLVISFHRIVDGTAGSYEYNVNNFETIVSYVASHNVATPTISEVVNNDLALISWADATTKLKYIGNQEYSGSDTFQYVVIDSAGSEGKMPADAGTATVTVTAVNDAPVNTVPGTQTINANTSLLFNTANNNAISIFDADAGTEAVRVQLTATNGNLTLGGTGGLSFTAGDGNADATMTFTGSIASINTALNGMSFTPTTNYSGAATVQIVTNDLGNNPSGALSDSDTVNITVASTSGPPVASDFAVSANEDAVVTVSQWSFTDPNGDSAQSIRITDLPDHGTLFLDANANSILDTAEAVSLNQVISWTDAKTTPKVKYLGSQNYSGQDSLAYVVIDSRGEEGVAPAGDGIGTITVAAVNDAPVNTIPGAQTINANTSLLFSTANNNAISISDVDAGSDSIRVQLTATNGSLTLGGTVGLSFIAGDGNADATMTFTGSIASINTALNGMSFTPTSNYSGAATVQIVTNDLGHNPSGELSRSDTVNITVATAGGAPVAGDFTLSVKEDTVVTVSKWTFTDPNGDSAQAIKITDLPDHGTLFLDANANSVLDTGEAVSLNQVISWSDAKTTPKVKYVGSQNYNGQDVLQYVVIDSRGTEGIPPAGDGTGTITVTAVNDAPVNSVPVAQSINEDTVLTFSAANNNAISISDVDAGTEPVRVQLTATSGKLTLSGTTGLTFSIGDGSADTTMTFTGSIDNINAALNGMNFAPNANYAGAASVKIVTNDLGNNPSGAKSDTDTIAVTVNAVDDAPVNSVPGTQTAVAGQILVFNSTNGNRITVSDADAGTNQIEVTLTATNGTLTLYSLTGLNFLSGDGKDDESMTFRGTVSAINAAINRLRFTPTVVGSANLSITTNDLGASGSGGPLTDTDSIRINVT